MNPGAPPAARSRWPAALGRALLVFFLYLGAAVVVTWPLAAQIDTHLLGHSFSDTTEYTRHIWWMAESVRSGSLSFFTPDPLLLYPDGMAAAWLWTAPLQSFPQWLFVLLGMSVTAANNVVALGTLALNGLAMWALMRALLREPLTRTRTSPPRPSAPALTPRPPLPQGEGETAFNRRLQTVVFTPLPEGEGPGVRASGLATFNFQLSTLLAGLVFAFYPAFQGQLGAGHTGLLVLWPMPLFVLALWRASEGKRPAWGWIMAAGALFAVSQWGNILLLLYVVLPFTGLFLLSLLWKRNWRGLGRALVALMLGGALTLPFALPTLSDVTSGAVVREEGVVHFSASLLTIAAPSFYNPLYSGLTFNRTILGQDPFEGAGYLGLITAGLALIAIWRVKRSRFWLLLGVLAWIASLGPVLKILDTPLVVQADGYVSTVSLPWALLQNLPILSMARTPARFNFTVGLAAAVLAGYGAAALGAWLQRRMRPPFAAAVLMALGLLLLLDMQWFNPLPTVPAGIPAAVRALGEDSSIRAVFDVPWQHALTDKDGMYLQTGHGLPLIGGHITRRTPLDPARGFLMQETLDPYLLNAAGVDVIILHKQWDSDPAARFAQLSARFGPPLHDDERIAVWRVTHDDTAEPVFLSHDALSGTLTDSASLYFYAPDAGEATLTLTLTSRNPRALSLSLNGETLAAPFPEAPLTGMASFTVPLAFEAGFHTVTLALDPPCPPDTVEALRCAAVEVSGVSLELAP